MLKGNRTNISVGRGRQRRNLIYLMTFEIMLLAGAAALSGSASACQVSILNNTKHTIIGVYIKPPSGTWLRYRENRLGDPMFFKDTRIVNGPGDGPGGRRADIRVEASDSTWVQFSNHDCGKPVYVDDDDLV